MMKADMEGYVSVEMDERLRQLLHEIFDDRFMRENTNFENFEAFRYSSAVIADWNAPRMVYAQLLMDGFVRESTRFSSFEEMVKAAADARFPRGGTDLPPSGAGTAAPPSENWEQAKNAKERR